MLRIRINATDYGKFQTSECGPDLEIQIITFSALFGEPF